MKRIVIATALLCLVIKPAFAAIVEQSNGYGQSINTSSDSQDRAQAEHNRQCERDQERTIKLGGGM